MIFHNSTGYRVQWPKLLYCWDLSSQLVLHPSSYPVICTSAHPSIHPIYLSIYPSIYFPSTYSRRSITMLWQSDDNYSSRELNPISMRFLSRFLPENFRGNMAEKSSLRYMYIWESTVNEHREMREKAGAVSSWKLMEKWTKWKSEVVPIMLETSVECYINHYALAMHIQILINRAIRHYLRFYIKFLWIPNNIKIVRATFL